MDEQIYIIPQPKLIKIAGNSGIRLNKMLNIYLNKNSIKDSSLLISNTINKHLGVFLNTFPIKDSYIKKKLGDNYFLGCISIESNYQENLKQKLNQIFSEKIKGATTILENLLEKEFNEEKNVFQILFDNEGYFIEISNETIWIISKTIKGFYYAIQTLNQILENAIFTHKNPDKYIIVPELSIIDFPHNEIRTINLKNNQFVKNIKDIKEIIPFFGELKISGLDLDVISKNLEEINDLFEFHFIIPNNSNYSIIIDGKTPILLIEPKIKTLLFSEILWNTKSNINLESIKIPEEFNWDYFSNAAGKKLFDINPKEITLRFKSLIKANSSLEFEEVLRNFEKITKYIYKNHEVIKNIEILIKK